MKGVSPVIVSMVTIKVAQSVKTLMNARMVMLDACTTVPMFQEAFAALVSWGSSLKGISAWILMNATIPWSAIAVRSV